MNRRMFLACSLTALAGCGKKEASAPSANDVQEFHSAVQDGDAEIIRRLLQAKPGLVNAKNQLGQTPLQVAKQKGADDLVEVLKKFGGTE